jgi:glycosyltransferase involved in cell wall biosynthesis/ubiquinone/menaquinone biosynthesis C-methylase UbiE
MEVCDDGTGEDLHSYDSPQTILFIGDFLYPPMGGAEKSALTILQRFVRDGHTCFALCKGTGEEVVYNEIHVRYVSHPGFIEQSIFQIKPSLIITQLNWACYGVDLAVKHHIPSILFIRSFEYFCATPVEFDTCDKNCASCQIHQHNRTIRDRFRPAVLGADEVVCNSLFMKKLTRDFYGRDSHVVYPPMEISDHECEHTQGTFIVMNQPEFHKGGDLFLELAKRMPDYPFMTVGRGNQTQLSNCVHYGQTDPLIFFQHARLLLVPSLLPEPFGRIAVEAMSNGIPVIASRTGGLPEVIGEAGILIDDYRNVDMWEKAIRTLLTDSRLYDTLSARSRDRSCLFECEQQISKLKVIVNTACELTSNSHDRQILNFYNKRYEKADTVTLHIKNSQERLEGFCAIINDGEFFLDAGCADGALMELLFHRNITGVGLDVAIPNIIRGMKQYPHLHFVHGYAEKIPFGDDFFDVVLLGNILERVRNPRSVIQESLRVAENLAICVYIGGKTREHISPYPTVDSVAELFEGLDVELVWFTCEMNRVERTDINVFESKPWIYLRVHRKSRISGQEDTLYAAVGSNNLSHVTDHENVRDEWADRIVTRDYQEVIRFHRTAQIVEGPEVLEMACGNGDMSVVIASKGVHVHGIDIMGNGIAWAGRIARAQ